MAKELTLEELANSSARTATAAPVSTPNLSGSNKGMKAVSTADLGAKLKEQHPEAHKEPVAEDSPLVKNAFEGMTKTLQEKKDFIGNVMMPIVEENAREIAMENALAEAKAEGVDTEPTPTVAERASEDDFGMLDDEEEADGEIKNYENVKILSVDVAEEPTQATPVKEEMPSPKVVSMPKTEEAPVVTDDDDEENGDLDSMLKDLGITEEDDESDLEEEETPEELRERFKQNTSTIKIAEDPREWSK